MSIKASINPARIAREACRSGAHVGPTVQLAPGFVQTNLVVLPKPDMEDFLLFASRNPKPCPVIEVIETGTEAQRTAPGSDIRTDLPGYRLFHKGVHVDSATDATMWWRDDLASVLLGCSFSFEAAMVRHGLPVRHLELGRNVPMFVTSHQCEPSESFAGPLVVTFRPMPKDLVETAVQVTEHYDHAHGGPVHIGDPSAIGIVDLGQPDFGDAVPIHDDEVPMFWACGITPQMALAAARPEIAITHEPGEMFITDLSDRESEESSGD